MTMQFLVFIILFPHFKSGGEIMQEGRESGEEYRPNSGKYTQVKVLGR